MKRFIHRMLPLLLAVLLPVMPLLRSLAPLAARGLAPSTWSIILKIGIGTAALLGSHDAVSGASVVSIQPPVKNGYSITLTNGIPFKVALFTSPYQAGSWTTNAVQNTTTPFFTIFPGFSLTNASGFLAGTSLTTGSRKTNYVQIYAWGEGEYASHEVSANFTNITLPAIPGTLVVTASPPALVTLAKNLTWNVDGIWQTNGFTNLFLDPGTHTVAFTNIPGWSVPPTQTVTITSGVPAKISKVYTQLFGGLQVNLLPLGPPASTGTWSVDGSPAYATGTITNLTAAVNHTLTFSSVGGYLTPGSQTITVTNGFTNVINLVYQSSALGTMLVNLGPASAVGAGASWQLDNGPWLPSGSATNGSPGGHTLNFTNVPGWVTPASQSVTLSPSLLTTVSATYAPATAALQVTLAPADAVAAGAEFQMDGGAWQPAGTLLTSLSPGSHIIAFNSIAGWVAPVSQSITLTNGQTNTVAAAYVPITAPVINQTSFDGVNLTINATGTPNAGFSVLATNSLALPAASWPVISSGVINPDGSLNYTDTVNTAFPQFYYRLRSP